MIKDFIRDLTDKALLSSGLQSEIDAQIVYNVERPSNPKFGDLSTNISFELSKKLKKSPLEIAEIIKNELININLFSNVSAIKPGFINFNLNPQYLNKNLSLIINKNHDYGKNKTGNKQKVLVEFVSANPTGPLTVGHGRGAILGDIISNIFNWNGYKVEREYYYNNAGRQMRVLGESLKARCYKLLNKDYLFPEDGYKGNYIIDIANNLHSKLGNALLDEKDDFFKQEAEKYIFEEINASNTLYFPHHASFKNLPNLKLFCTNSTRE